MEVLKSILTAVGMLLMMAAVFAGAYWAPKLLARRYKSRNMLPDKLEIVSRVLLGKDQALIVAKAAERVFLLGVTAQSISLISELDPADFPVSPVGEQVITDTDFMSVLKNVLKYPKSGEHGRDKDR